MSWLAAVGYCGAILMPVLGVVVGLIALVNDDPHGAKITGLSLLMGFLYFALFGYTIL